MFGILGAKMRGAPAGVGDRSVCCIPVNGDVSIRGASAKNDDGCVSDMPENSDGPILPSSVKECEICIYNEMGYIFIVEPCQSNFKEQIIIS